MDDNHPHRPDSRRRWQLRDGCRGDVRGKAAAIGFLIAAMTWINITAQVNRKDLLSEPR